MSWGRVLASSEIQQQVGDLQKESAIEFVAISTLVADPGLEKP